MTDWPPYAKPFRANPPEGTAGIVLPIRNDLRFFKLCFHSLLAFTDYRFMLTVVDNDSTMKTFQYLESIRRNHPVNVLQYEKPHNLAGEWNLGLRFMFAFSTVKFGVVLTPTVVFEPFWLTSMIHALQNDPDIATAIPCTEGGASDVLMVRRAAFEQLGGFDEAAEDPAKDFVVRSIQKTGSTGLSSAFVHRFKFESFNPKREQPQEATHARA